MYGIRFFLRVQVATNIPGHGYASANANRPEVVMSINFSANIFGQTFRPSFFCRKGAPRKWIYLHKESRVAEIWTETSESGA